MPVARGERGNEGGNPRRAAADLELTPSAGIAECRHRGWAVVHVAGEGFRPCRPDEPGAYVDLSRYAYWRDNRDARLAGGASFAASQGE